MAKQDTKPNLNFRLLCLILQAIFVSSFALRVYYLIPSAADVRILITAYSEKLN